MNALKKQGYQVDYRELQHVTMDHQLSVRDAIARRDGLKIQWPQPTHGHPDSIQVQKGNLNLGVPPRNVLTGQLNVRVFSHVHVHVRLQLQHLNVLQVDLRSLFLIIQIRSLLMAWLQF